MTGRVFLTVENTLTRVHGADPFLLKILDLEARYPTESALPHPGLGNENYQADGTWDGWVRLLRTPKTMPAYFPTGLLSRLERIARKWRYDVQVTDQRVRPPEGFPELLSEPIVDRGYQLGAVEAGVRTGRGVLDMPPRSGKTRVMCEIQRQIAVPTVWIAPTDRICVQTQETLEGFFGKNYSMHLVGTKNVEEAMSMHVVVCTAATAARLGPEFYKSREMLVVDEWHHGAAKTYPRDIFSKCDHIFYRFGMTGTFFRSNGDDLAMHASLSNTIYKVSTQFLLERGYLVPTRVGFMPMPKSPMLRGVPNNFITGHGKHGVHEHVVRNKLAAWSAVSLQRMGRKTLVLVGTKKQGNMIKKFIDGFLGGKGRGHEFERCEFVSTDVVRPKQQRIIDSFLDNQEVEILVGTSLLGEGVDLPTVDALVYARGEKASVSLTQNAFRVCTAVPGKSDAVIIDFADRQHSKLLKHSKDRLGIFYREPIFSTEVLDDANRLASWL